MGRYHIPSTIGLEHPPFGQFARQLFGLRSRDVEECLRFQMRDGGRSGEILRQRNLLTRAQTISILATQARWVAAARVGDLEPQTFPLPCFLSLCLPAFNEDLNIGETLDAACAILPAFVTQFEIIVIDDGSHDRTADAVAGHAAFGTHVRLIRHPVNRGYGAAVTTGLRAAQGELIAFMDADGQFSLLDLPQLFTRLNGHDAVVGYRYRRVDNSVRRLNAWAWNRLVRLLLRVEVRDLDCAFKLFRRRVVQRLHLTSTGAAINAEIMTQCAQAGFRVSELPVTHYPRYHGSPTGAAVRVIARAFRELPQLLKYRVPSGIARARLRRQEP